MKGLYAVAVETPSDCWQWERQNLESFRRLTLSWNALRPPLGAYHLYISLYIDDWTPWISYATWGASSQHSYCVDSLGALFKIDHDEVIVSEGKQATGFRVKVTGAPLSDLHRLYVSTLGETIDEFVCKDSVSLSVDSLHQMNLPHPSPQSLCSPTSVTAVLRYLLSDDSLDPVTFAKRAQDGLDGIYGNWAFNVAEAYASLGKGWRCWAGYVASFQEVIDFLDRDCPVVVSVQGPLPGSATAYTEGHLMVVSGYDGKEGKVFCMDPAHGKSVSYSLGPFLEAWQRRHQLAYLFARE